MTAVNAEAPTKSSDVILIAIDGSKESQQAFEWYIEHLHKEGNRVVLVHAMEVGSMPTRDTWEDQMSTSRKKQQQLQDDYTAKFKELKIVGKFIADCEKPGEFLVESAKKENATYVVMGTRGLGKFRRTIMGSVSDYVVHHAVCPVLVCRQK